MRRDEMGWDAWEGTGRDMKGKERKGTLCFNQSAEGERERESLQGISLRLLLIDTKCI